ncbi:MAG: tRNA uridine-5-carboxymethylaminomethyl(34) synthesis enzyme MnmG, partial [Bacilli bacterium]|nr:tRNA uridine-5-carboxymethylaminomethyl(34) synthesis enzyme MnmG [Bacilli bacterium]
MYDLIVVGGGHAGCEAAHIGAVLGLNTALVTANIKNIADMPCNPSIGGTAKGIIVREIDALGGIMGVVADKSHFQIKMLNNGKGPAVRSLRAQADKTVYPKIMLETLQNTPNLTIVEGMVEDLIIEDNTVKGIILKNGDKLTSQAVVLTTGTYLKGNILIGSENTPGGPHGEERSNHLSDNLKKLGLNIQRLKTGTPPRIQKDSVDFSKMQPEYGDSELLSFSHDIEPSYKISEQQRCYLLYTTPKTHEIIKENLSKSAMYGGYVTGIGPRYCPSIEDKIVRFADKERHQLFMEPESLHYDEWYLQGFSTSMPRDVQELMVHSLPGLENAVITKYAYAIEYDAIDPLQMKPSLENKIITNLFTAGQINGTSGYEEAAAQGLIAGINAHHKIKNIEPLILKRNEAYIGVLIDDLVTKGTGEPYRMLTSRAEYRLILRHDNADLRLREIGYQNGTIDEARYQKLKSKINAIEEIKNLLQSTNIKISDETKNIFIKNNLEVPTYSVSLYLLLKRPEIKIDFLKEFIELNYSREILEEVEIEVKYEGYIAKAYKEAEKMLKLEEKLIPEDIDYKDILNLASEARQKLEKIRPKSIGQAARISGVNPSDLSILSVYL